MEFLSFDCGDLPVMVETSRFRGQAGVEEVHLVARPTEDARADVQLDWVERACGDALESIGADERTAVLRRFFCSDLPNQTSVLRARPFSNAGYSSGRCAVSWVGQPPMFPARVALWAYHVIDPGGELDKTQEGTCLKLSRGELSHHWTTGMICPTVQTVHGQTSQILAEYNASLRARNMFVTDNLIRTWFFVKNIDANYKGFVDARREFFAEHGLTPETHYVASSGIGGVSADVTALVAMDAYAISGVRREQIEFVEALDHLCPTHAYGVTFERATAVAYQDRKHVMLSGTASIDRRGKILYPGDVTRQLERSLENMEALLKRAGATLKDVGVFVVYVRNPSDQMVARQQMRARIGNAPTAVVLAPICRPGWLIEIEGQAVVSACKPELLAF